MNHHITEVKISSEAHSLYTTHHVAHIELTSAIARPRNLNYNNIINGFKLGYNYS